ncbi:hypothetical protein QOZ80_9AG0691930 [Eleusine coracana subsp. coracana]|nr:hypothetical protein QOZ80_9AG0691930 [Eleusine coracana subsp. coracana]
MAFEVVGVLINSVDAIIRIVHAITEAVRKVRRNKEECKEIANYVASVSVVLKGMYGSTPAMAMDPVLRGTLDDLMVSLHHALGLVTECQDRRRVLRFLRSGEMTRELGRVHDDITRKVMLSSFAANVQTYIMSLTNMQYRPPPPPPPPDPSMAKFCCPSTCDR